MRSSSEWKVTTTSRPPASSSRSAAAEALGQLVELRVEIEAERLKGAGGGVLGLVALAAENAGDDVGKLAGPCDRRLGAARHDGLGDGARPPLLAENVNDIGEFCLWRGVLTMSAAVGPSAPMRMSSGPSCAKEKPRSGWSSCMEDTPRSSVTPSTRVEALAGGDRFHLAVAAEHGHEPARICFGKRAAQAKGFRIAIDGDDLAVGRIENGLRIAAGAERAVDDDLAVLGLKRGQDLGEHHGNVAGRSASGSRCCRDPPSFPCSLWPAASAAPRAE